jgi:hypothetical protein
MARSRLLDPTIDIVTDSGSVLWSFVTGEQLEFPVNLNFVEDVTAGYTYEAVVLEADNTPNQTIRPIASKPNGVVNNLIIRVPVYRGNWDAAQAYNREEVVLYNSKYYRLVSGVAQTSSIAPSNASSNWVETSLSRVYLQFPKTLASTWTQKATVSTPVYGFFELRVTEPQDSVYVRTWKPVRGMVEILFSPTYSADD